MPFVCSNAFSYLFVFASFFFFLVYFICLLLPFPLVRSIVSTNSPFTQVSKSKIKNWSRWPYSGKSDKPRSERKTSTSTDTNTTEEKRRNIARITNQLRSNCNMLSSFISSHSSSHVYPILRFVPVCFYMLLQKLPLSGFYSFYASIPTDFRYSFVWQ